MKQSPEVFTQSSIFTTGTLPEARGPKLQNSGSAEAKLQATNPQIAPR